MKTAKLTILATVCAVAILASLGPASAQAVFGFKSFEVSYEDPDGNPMYEAGRHANVKTDFRMLWGGAGPVNEEVLDEGIKDIEVDLPAGFYGDPTIIPDCNVEELFIREGVCPIASQVGWMDLQFKKNHEKFLAYVPVYKLPTTTKQTAMLGAVVLGVLVRIEVSVRTDGDYGLKAKILRTNQGLNVFGNELVLWGVPADPGNDSERFASGFFPGAPAATEPRPFLSVPSRCEPMTTTIRANSWQHPDKWIEATSTTPPLTGCDDLVFEPRLDVRPQGNAAGEPTGLGVDLTIPQDDSVKGRATPQLRRAVVTLPEGVAISPGSAAGLGSCSDAAIAVGTNTEPACPDSSKLGTVTVETPVLDEDLTGDLYLGDPQPGNLFRLFMVLHGPGLLIKIPGIAKPDPVTGQITTTFDETPQLPFEKMHLEFKGGPRAPISMPTACGTYSTHSVFTSWSSPNPVTDDSSFTIEQNCGNEGRFTPDLEAGTTNPTAGSSSAFTLRVIGQNGQQNLSRIQTTLPEGLLAKLAGVGVCGDAAAAGGNCSADSLIGRTVVGAGPGSSPVYVPQPGKAPTAVYLGGPYKGAPYSLVAKVPAQAGPFDLGTVVVRNALHIDPVTTQVTAKSDPLPQILEGVPIAYRDVRVEVDRPGFIRNPTDCEPMKVTSVLTSIAGATASPSTRFQAASCASLGFKPKLALRLSGAPTHRGGHPALKAVLTMPKGSANIGRAQVTLPKTEFLENAHIRTICTRVQYAADNCPKASVYGFAKAWSPLLDRPLEGPVYLRSSNHTLPDLVASLDGQIHVDLSGRISSANRRIRNTFDFVPDAPVSKFVLKMQGGQKSLLVNNSELCKAKPRAEANFTGQNGRHSLTHPRVKVACGGKKK